MVRRISHTARHAFPVVFAYVFVFLFVELYCKRTIPSPLRLEAACFKNQHRELHLLLNNNSNHTQKTTVSSSRFAALRCCDSNHLIPEINAARMVPSTNALTMGDEMQTRKAYLNPLHVTRGPSI